MALRAAASQDQDPNEYGQSESSSGGRGLPVACILVLLCGFVRVCTAQDSDAPFRILENAVIVHAESAVETEDGASMIFEGNLTIHANDWRIDANRALLAGALNDPDRIVVDGEPAVIVVAKQGDPEPFEGRAEHLEFEPGSKLVRLAGAAMIAKGAQSISSESIEYQLGKGTFSAGAQGRVKIVTKPFE
jgi:lipopolysaccharide transport protein LptA